MKMLRHLAMLAPIALLATAGTALAADPKKPATPTATSQQQPQTASAERGRDWNQIDTNRDGLVSPEEMEKWLAANPGPLRGK